MKKIPGTQEPMWRKKVFMAFGFKTTWMSGWKLRSTMGTHNHHFLGGITHILGMKTFIFHGFGVQGNGLFHLLTYGIY